MELKEQFEQLQSELKTYFEKAKAQQEQTGTVTTELKSQIEKIQVQIDAIDQKIASGPRGGGAEESVADFLQKHDGLQRLMKDRSGSCRIDLDAKMVRQLMEAKTTVTSSAVGNATSGVLQIDRTPGIVPAAQQVLRMRSVISARPTSMNQIDFVKVSHDMTKASPQTEASDKDENIMTFTTATALIKTIATWIPATKQVLADFGELMGFLQSNLRYQVMLEEEKQVLSGDGTGNNLNGLLTQAQSFDTSLLVAAAGYNRIDCIGRAMQQIQADKEFDPSFVVVHPDDWWSIRLTKDSYGRYILGDPMQPLTVPNIFGLNPVVTTNITSGTFLVGSGSPVCSEIRDREGISVEISTQHSDYFIKNMVAILAEERVCLVVYRPNAFVTGSFTTSPST